MRRLTETTIGPVPHRPPHAVGTAVELHFKNEYKVGNFVGVLRIDNVYQCISLWERFVYLSFCACWLSSRIIWLTSTCPLELRNV